MEYKNNEQNSVIFSVAEILGKMSNQVGFLIRNNKLMSQLDVDMLMENTRKLYDTICSVRCNMDVDSIPMEVVKGEDGHGVEDTEDTEDIEVQRYRGIEVSEESEAEDEEPRLEDEEQQDLIEEREFVEDEYMNDEEEVDEEEPFEDDYMYDDEEDSDEEEIVEDECEDDEKDNDGDEIKIDFEIPSQETPSSTPSEDSGIRAYKKVNNEYFTIGDVLEQVEDNSLAARLQKKPVADLTTAIGINDKFLLLNELFGGSMERYNKSIRALNNFSTYLGAMTYMSELQIELQWDCSSDAYKKLADLVERRFI